MSDQIAISEVRLEESEVEVENGVLLERGE